MAAPAASSLAYSTPTVVLPVFPVSFPPNCGSTIVRVWTGVNGA